MIRMVMLGRLGNNLFQYAFGRALAMKYGVPLVLDASWFNGRTWPFVEPLRSFPGVKTGAATVARPFSTGSRVLRKLTGKHHWEYLGKPVIRESVHDHSFDPTLLDSPSDCVVFGYFQSPAYFRGIETEIREELATSGLGLEAGRENLADQLRSASSVAVHVRRTDYVNNPNLVQLSPDYYHRAMDRMREAVHGARFFVFSDDPAWCVASFKAPDVQVIRDSNPLLPLHDLHLMSLASHHIIANSSFSWWAAWLGKKNRQQVFMPDRWFVSGIRTPIEEKRCNTWTLLPSGNPDE